MSRCSGHDIVTPRGMPSGPGTCLIDGGFVKPPSNDDSGMPNSRIFASASIGSPPPGSIRWSTGPNASDTTSASKDGVMKPPARSAWASKSTVTPLSRRITSAAGPPAT